MRSGSQSLQSCLCSLAQTPNQNMWNRSELFIFWHGNTHCLPATSNETIPFKVGLSIRNKMMWECRFRTEGTLLHREQEKAADSHYCTALLPIVLFSATNMNERSYYGKWGCAACQQSERQMLYFQPCVGPCLPFSLVVNSLFTTSEAWDGGGSAPTLAAINKEGSRQVGTLAAKAITHWSGSDSVSHLPAMILA